MMPSKKSYYGFECFSVVCVVLYIKKLMTGFYIATWKILMLY